MKYLLGFLGDRGAAKSPDAPAEVLTKPTKPWVVYPTPGSVGFVSTPAGGHPDYLAPEAKSEPPVSSVSSVPQEGDPSDFSATEPWPAVGVWAAGAWRRVGSRWEWTAFGYEAIDWGDPP